MKNLLSLLAIFTLSIGAALGQTTKTQSSTDLVARLPASDVVTTIDLKRFLDEALPQVLANKPEELAKINNYITEIKSKTGVDLRSFEQAAIGFNLSNITFRKLPDTRDGVVLLRGSFNSAALIAAGKTAAKDKFKIEKIGDRTVTIFTPSEVVKNSTKDNANVNPIVKSKIERFFDNLIKGDVAVTAFDNSTILLGNSESVRSLLTDSSNRVTADMQAVFQRKSSAIMNFAVSVPAKKIPQIGDANLDSTISAISLLSGSLDVREGNAIFQMKTQTAKPRELSELFELGKVAGESFIRNRALRGFVKSLTISKTATEVNLESTLPASDITMLFD